MSQPNNRLSSAIDRLFEQPDFDEKTIANGIRHVIQQLFIDFESNQQYFQNPQKIISGKKQYDASLFSPGKLLNLSEVYIPEKQDWNREHFEIIYYHIHGIAPAPEATKLYKSRTQRKEILGKYKAPNLLITKNNYEGTKNTIKFCCAILGIIPEQLSLALTEKIAPTSDQHEPKTTEVEKPTESLPTKKSQPNQLITFSVFVAALAITLFWFKDDLVKTENPKTDRSEIQSSALLGKSRPASGSATDSVAIKIIGTTTNQYFTFGNNQAPVEEVLLRFIIANHSSQHFFPDEIMAFATAIEGQPNGQLTTASQHQSDDCPIISLTASKPYFSAIIINSDDRLPSIAPHTEITGLVKITMQGKGQQLYQCEASMRLHNQSNQNHTLTLYNDLIYMQ